MNPLSAFKVAYRAIASNKVRSILTTLGIIIGVAAVISLVAVTQGAEKMIEDQLTSLGGSSFLVKTGKRGVGSGSQQKVYILTPEDAEAIEELDMVTHVSPLIDLGQQIIYGNQDWFTLVIGVGPDFVNINDWYTDRGNFFNNQDVENRARVVVLGKTVADNLFGSQNPIGQSLRINKNTFTVIGVMSSLGQTSGGRDQDDVVLIPYSTFQRYIRAINQVESISVSVKSSEDIPVAESQIISLLRERHRYRPDQKDEFYIKSQLSIINRIFAISRIMTILLASVASISLIVGGIGIMNIMLVSVGERTREIGIRMAVGAKQRDILIQFLIESVLLSLAGGVIGVILGILGSKVASSFTNWPVVISFGAMILAFSVAAVIGIFFGIYPARKASQLDPIEALRYE
ncbi:MAG: ABC transporter permease [Thermodesulfobacteriota bacterium]